MEANVGMTDRWLRMSLGAVLIALVFVGPQSPWGWLGLFLLASGMMRFCPIYKLLGLTSCES